MKSINENEKKLFKEFKNANVVKFKYFDNYIYFLNQEEPLFTRHENISYDPWVSWTGLTTNRPLKIIDFLVKRNIIKNGDSIMDVGCGLAEMGIEINRRNIDCSYVGLEINPLLQKINKLNLPKFEFYVHNLLEKNDNYILDKKYNVVMLMGAASDHHMFSDIINNKIKPSYVICETHIRRNNDLENIIKKLKNYTIELKHNYIFENNVNYYNYRPAYNRIMYVLKLKSS